MNMYKLAGRMTRFASIIFSNIKFKNIQNHEESHHEFKLNHKNGDTSSFRYLPSGVQGIYWSTEDFRGKAAQLEDDNWENVYDETKFQKALEMMIHKHDCNNGITWDTVNYWLDELCRK